MLNLKTAKGERLEIPESAIAAITKPSNGEAPAGIIFDMGSGDQAEHLQDQYGFVKKLVVDSHLMINAIEVTVAEPAQGENAQPGEVALGKIFFSRDRILARKEILGDPRGINAQIFVHLFGRTQILSVLDTLDEMDGTTSEKPDAKDPSPVVSIAG